MDIRLWLSGLRARTLPASVAPVAVGAALAWHDAQEQLRLCSLDSAASGASSHAAMRVPWFDCGDSFVGSPSWFWLLAVPCLGVALGLQIAVNFANDYSDGIRGSDVGRGATEGETGKPRRLVASGVNPRWVLAAAGLAAAVACLAGLFVIVAFGRWWLLAVGIASLIAGWCYTGGKHPYGYVGLGEASVFLFFGPVAVMGTHYAMTGGWTGTGIRGVALAIAASMVCGLNSVKLLMVNNLRDIDADKAAGKRTLAVRLGRKRAVTVLNAMVWIPAVVSAAAMVMLLSFAGIGFGFVPLFAGLLPVRNVNEMDWGRGLAFAGLVSVVSAACWCMALTLTSLP